MFHPMKMLRRVLILRRIAATYMSALQAQSQMHPAVAHLEALLAPSLVGLAEFDVIQMTALLCHDACQSTPKNRSA